MEKIMTIGRVSGTALAVLMFAVLPLAPVQAADLPGEEYEYYTTYTPTYDYYTTYTPDYEYYSTYTPTYDTYDYYTTYTPDYEYYTTYTPDYDYYTTYTPSYEDNYDYYTTYTPSYASSYASASASAYSYASSYSYGGGYGNYYSDSGCKKNCGHDKPKPKPVCALNISPSHVDYGEDATIHWTSENATSATLTEFGSVSTGGSKEIDNIKHDKTYTLTVKGPGGTATCSDKVEVEEKKDDLECKLRVSDSRIERGDTVRVSWSSEGADYGRISPDIGRVDEDGSETIRLYEDTEFEGTFYNDDGDKVTCDVDVEVDRDVYIPPHTPYVTLSQVPYTGFELGPVGTVIYWSLLSLWCLIAAYLIAVKKAHVGIARRLNSFLFGRDEVVVTATPVAHSHGHAHVAHTAHAHAAHNDSTDEFVLSQLNRGRHAH